MQVLGSTRLLAAPNGSPVQGTTAHYLPYGDYRGAAPTATPLTERGYTGHHENREMGLTYMNARFYSPTSSRFLTADTIVPDAADPQAHNRYTYSLGNPIVLFDSTGHCAEAFTGALREDNLQGNDGACWSMYYNWLDQGYLGLDPSWDYLRVDIWLIEELYLQHGVSFASIWVYQWSADAIELDAAASLRCYGLNCSVSYQRLTIEASDGYYTLLMDGVPAWLFQSFYTALDGLGRDVMHPIRGIGTDPNSHLREAMQAYGTAYTNYWNAFEDMLIAGAGTIFSGVGIILSPLGGPVAPIALGASLIGLGFSVLGVARSIHTMNISWDAQVSSLATINQSIYALQVGVYD